MIDIDSRDDGSQWEPGPSEDSEADCNIEECSHFDICRYADMYSRETRLFKSYDYASGQLEETARRNLVCRHEKEI